MDICVFVMQDLLESPAQGGSSLLRGMGVPCLPCKLLSVLQGGDSGRCSQSLTVYLLPAV